MNYLARGLPPAPSATRLALTPEESLEHWKFLGITPLHYPLTCPPNRHHIFSEAIAEWANYSQWGLLDHEQRIRAIVESPPPLDRETTDLIDSALRQQTTTRFFTRYTKTPAWLLWAERKQAFQSLFQADTAPDPIAVELASWFAHTFVCQHPTVALSVVERQRRRIHPVLWEAITLRLGSGEPRPAQTAFANWIIVLMHSQPRHSPSLSWLLKRCQPQDPVTAILLFEHLTRPHLDLQPTVRPPDAASAAHPDVGLSFLGDPCRLKEAWQALFRPHLAIFAERLEPILTSHLHQAHLLLRATGKACANGAPFSDGRSAVEPRPHDQYGQGTAMLIEAARDVLGWMLAHKPGQARTVITAWSNSDVPILRRLAIPGVTDHSSGVRYNPF